MAMYLAANGLRVLFTVLKDICGPKINILANGLKLRLP